jgi:gas vesicle protein
MSTTGLLLMGVLVTAIVGTAVAVLLYAAVLDGRGAETSEPTTSSFLAATTSNAEVPDI